MKPRRTSLRASIDQLTRDLVREILGAVRGASFEELDELLRSPDSHRALAAPATAPPTGTSSHDVLAGLTPQQRNVFERALHGARNADIAGALGISLKTVQTHRAQVNKRLGVRSASELVRFGAIHGLLSSPGAAGLPPRPDAPPAPAAMFNLAQVERLTIGAAMSATEGDRDRAAGLLGISRSAFDAKLRPLKPAVTPPSDPAIPHLPAPSRRVASRTTRRPRNASIVAELTPPVLEPLAAPAPPVRAGERLLRAAGGGVVLRRRPRSAESPKLAEE